MTKCFLLLQILVSHAINQISRLQNTNRYISYYPAVFLENVSSKAQFNVLKAYKALNKIYLEG